MPYQDIIPLHPLAVVGGGVISTGVWTYPTAIDSRRLQDALDHLARPWPTITSRFIKLPNDHHSRPHYYTHGLQLRPERKATLSTVTLDDEPPFEEDWVEQKNLGAFITSIGSFTDPETYPELFTLKLTILKRSGGCVLGSAMAHVIGDGATHYTIMKALSGLYAAPETVLESPTYDVDWSDQYDLSTVQDVEALTAGIMRGVPPAKAQAVYSSVGSTSLLRFRLTKGQIDRMKLELQGKLGSDHPTLSTQDCLSGWYASLLEQVSVPLRTIQYLLNTRRLLEAPEYSPSAIQWLPISIEESSTKSLSGIQRAGDIALSIRNALIRLRRDTKFKHDWFIVQAALRSEAINKGLVSVFLTPPDEIYVNSYLQFDWRSISFGHPETSVSYHNQFGLPRGLHVSRSNGATLDGVEMAFSVESGLAARISHLAQHDMRRWRET